MTDLQISLGIFLLHYHVNTHYNKHNIGNETHQYKC